MFLLLFASTMLFGCRDADVNTPPSLSQSEVEQIVRAEMTREQPAAVNPGLTHAEVEEIVQAAIADISASEPETPLNSSDVQGIVQDAIAGLPTPETGLSPTDVEEIVQAARAEPAQAEPGLGREEVQRIARNAVATIPLKSAPADYTRFFVDNAVSRYETEGLEATISYYNRVESVDGQWYVFIVDEEGKVIGHHNSHLLGEDLEGPIGTDVNGYNFGPDMLSADEEGRWVSYVYRNPETSALGSDRSGELQLKNAWVVRYDGLLFASGWYVPADEFTQSMVFAAVNKFRSAGLPATIEYFTGPESVYSGLAATIEYYNSAETVEGEWFALIADRSGKIVDHYEKELVGKDISDIFGTDMFEATVEGNWVNTESLRAWVVSHDGLLFASGWHVSANE